MTPALANRSKKQQQQQQQQQHYEFMLSRY